MYAMLASKTDPSIAFVIQTIVILFFVILAIIVVLSILRRLTIGARLQFITKRKKAKPRLRIYETLALDRTRRLVLVGVDERQHVLLLGGSSELIIETHVVKPYSETEENASTFNVPPQASDPLQEETLEDASIADEIEGRREPSLSIPTFPPR
ncbi:flagellar biosynthetic protein FliO [Bartonella sp. DGB2]|uniref:flagellar biosynthetic protein FliO n=1 Tax=Bartonella sp. DGB2 TaxID=3388426 RepID=UPI00398FE731